MKAWAVGLAGLVLSTGLAQAEVPDVVASIKPVQSLVASVMGELGTPALLVKGSASPHTYSLRPSDAALLENADIVFWTGHGLELFLSDALDALASDSTIVELAEAPGITLLPVREGGAFEAHEGEAHAHEAGEAYDDHEHEEADLHFFLDPDNAKLMVDAIAASLAAADPENRATYDANAEATRARLDQLRDGIAAKLQPVADRPFIVFHDAYQYFENRFGVSVAGSVTVTPEVAPGAQRVEELHAKIVELGASCVFSEPNFQPAIVSVILEGSSARAGVLDPEGSGLEEGPDLYFNLLQSLADNLVTCLSAQAS